jgi:hypothetical protein
MLGEGWGIKIKKTRLQGAMAGQGNLCTIATVPHDAPAKPTPRNCTIVHDAVGSSSRLQLLPSL